MLGLDKLKNILFGEDTSNYELFLQEVKNNLDTLIEEYNNFIGIQEEFKKDPSFMLNQTFEKKEKYPEIMDKIKYKDVELIKEYELYAMKYNILVELYNKTKKYIFDLGGQNLILDFKVDKYKQPVAILSQYKGDTNKILLIKNTFAKEDYLYYKVGNDIEIIDILSNEPNVHHGAFMIEALMFLAKLLSQRKIANSEIVVSKELTDKLGFENCLGFFEKQGFMVINGIFTKKIE